MDILVLVGIEHLQIISNLLSVQNFRFPRDHSWLVDWYYTLSLAIFQLFRDVKRGHGDHIHN